MNWQRRNLVNAIRSSGKRPDSFYAVRIIRRCRRKGLRVVEIDGRDDISLLPAVREEVSDDVFVIVYTKPRGVLPGIGENGSASNSLWANVYSLDPDGCWPESVSLVWCSPSHMALD